MEKESVNLGNAFDLGDIPKVRKVTGARKAAILLITLGADVAADIVKKLAWSIYTKDRCRDIKYS